MGKKKSGRQKHQRDAGDPDTSDDERSSTSNKGCPHTSRAVNPKKLKRCLRSDSVIEMCTGCAKNSPRDVCDDPLNMDDIWLCLQCGHYGCGRNSPSQHAILHYRTPHSDSHAIVLNTTSLCVWCYECDSEVSHRTSNVIKECLEILKKKKSAAVGTQASVNNILPDNKGNSLMNEVVLKDTEELKPSVTNGKVVVGESSESSPLVANSKSILEESENVQPSRMSRKLDLNQSKASVKGLRNLGNTCFFNAVMQNLNQTFWLLNELENYTDKKTSWELPFPELNNMDDGIRHLRVTLGDGLPLTHELLVFLRQMCSEMQSKKIEVINPGSLFEQVCKKAPEFRGFQQQDSHELLRQLLDGVRNEEIRRQKRGILKSLNLEKLDRNSVDEETRQIVRGYAVYASHTLVERIFGGMLLNTVFCEKCKMSSQVFEPFMDLSLPLAAKKPKRLKKGHKFETLSDGMQNLAEVKEENIKPSKYQERKMKQQAKKIAKRQAKQSKTRKEELVVFPSEETSINKVEHSHDQILAEKRTESDNELSDADVEDNEDSESVSVTLQPVRKNNEGESGSDKGIQDGEGHSAQELDEKLKEICSQITDIRVRRDSDRQENFLDSFDVQANSNKNEENGSQAEPKSLMQSQPDQQKEWIRKALTTVKPRYQPSAYECSVYSCLNQFTASELLTGSNKFRCENCMRLQQEASGSETEVPIYSNACKSLLIFSPPAVLTLHLKRFQQAGMSLQKLNLFVEFPQMLDLAPFCSSVCLELPHLAGVKDEILYSLYGIVQHSGSITSGHYTAFVRVRDKHLNPVFLNNWPVGKFSVDELLERIRKVKTSYTESDTNLVSSSKNKWFYISDHHVSEVSEAEVFKSQAYILFYERVK